MSVQRYHYDCERYLEPEPDGEWVKYTEHAALVSILTEALEELHAVQNGAPLIRDAIVWHEAMQKTEYAIRIARGDA